MKILKDGIIETRWIGECSVCGAVSMADERHDNKLLSAVKYSEKEGDSRNGKCPFCLNENVAVIFRRLGSPEAKKILRKNNLSTIYKREDIQWEE